MRRATFSPRELVDTSASLVSSPSTISVPDCFFLRAPREGTRRATRTAPIGTPGYLAAPGGSIAGQAATRRGCESSPFRRQSFLVSTRINVRRRDFIAYSLYCRTLPPPPPLFSIALFVRVSRSPGVETHRDGESSFYGERRVTLETCSKIIRNVGRWVAIGTRVAAGPPTHWRAAGREKGKSMPADNIELIAAESVY